MASRSMNYLRKNAKMILVFMGIVCMITFVVGTSLLDLVNSRSDPRESQNPVVVTWVKGKVHQDEIHRMRLHHQVAYVFLRQVVAQAVERGGRPVINGRPVTSAQEIPDIIAQDTSDETLIRTMVLAEEARRLGVVVDLESVKAFLRQLSSPELGEADWLRIAQEVVSNRMTVNELNEQLALQLKAQHVASLARGGLFSHGTMPIVPPGEAWEMFNRLNRRLAIEAYPIEVEPLIGQVKGEPTAAEIEKLFDEGKFRDPDPTIDEPGFRQPHKLAFTYLKVNFAPFLEEAKKQITDEQIAEQYQKDIAQGMHKVQELPSATPPGDKPASEADKPAAETEAEKKDTPKAPEDSKSSAKPDADKPDADKPDADKPDADKPDADKADSDKPAADKPAEPAAKAETAADKAANKPTDKTTDKPGDQPDCGASGEQAESKQDVAAKGSDETPPDSKPAGASAEEAKSVEARPNEAKSSAAQPDAARSTTEKPADGKPAEEKPAEEKPADAAAPAKEQKFKPLAEVRDEIHKRLAQPIADEARKKAVAEVTSAIDKYGKLYRRYHDVISVRKNADIKDPGKLDIVPLAAKYGFEIGDTGLRDGRPVTADRHDIAKFEIGQKVQQFDMQAAQMGQLRYFSFADIAYSREQPLYQAGEVRSSEPDISYLYFRTAEDKAADATLEKARPQIIEFWRRRKAFELAKADAQKLADKAKTAPALAEVVPDPLRVIMTAPFSWMTTGSFGFGRPELSQVPGIELPGQEFMEAVFALQPSETGVAPNQAHSKVYVVRVVTQDPSDEQLRTRFLESGYNQLVLSLAQNESFQTWFKWIDDLLVQYHVKWQRQAQDDRRI